MSDKTEVECQSHLNSIYIDLIVGTWKESMHMLAYKLLGYLRENMFIGTLSGYYKHKTTSEVNSWWGNQQEKKNYQL